MFDSIELKQRAKRVDFWILFLGIVLAVVGLMGLFLGDGSFKGATVKKAVCYLQGVAGVVLIGEQFRRFLKKN